MDCRKVYRNLSAYLDNTLPPNIQVEVSEHLKGCSACRRRLEVFQRVANSASEMGNLKAPDDMEERVLTAISQYEYKQRKREAFKLKERVKPRWMLGFSFAVSAAVILMGFLFSSTIFTPDLKMQLADDLGISPEKISTDFNKSDLVLDNPGEVIKVVQDLQGNSYLLVKPTDSYPYFKRDFYRADTLSSNRNFRSKRGGNGGLLRTSAEIVF